VSKQTPAGKANNVGRFETGVVLLDDCERVEPCRRHDCRVGQVGDPDRCVEGRRVVLGAPGAIAQDPVIAVAPRPHGAIVLDNKVVEKPG
jgi:hypothetical protein